MVYDTRHVVSQACKHGCCHMRLFETFANAVTPMMNFKESSNKCLAHVSACLMRLLTSYLANAADNMVVSVATAASLSTP